MSRKLLPAAVLVVLLAISASAAPPATPLPTPDLQASTATNGQSTLVAWTNMPSVYAQGHSVYMRILDSPFDRNAIYVAGGTRPKVATNGNQYLIGYSIGGSRFNGSYPYDNTAVQLVSPEGILLGSPRIINRSIYGGLLTVAWNGQHWLVAYTAGYPSVAYVAFLDDSLNVVARLELGLTTAFALEEIGGRWWAFRGDEVSAEAVELRVEGTIGARFPTARFGPNVYVTHGHAPLVLTANGDHIDAIPFDPLTGFGTPFPFLESTRLHAVEPLDGGSLLLVASSEDRYDTIFVSATGEIGPRSPLIETPTNSFYNSLGRSKNGLLFFHTPFGDDADLYAYRVPPSRAPIDPASGQLISQRTLSNRRRSARH